MIERIRVAVATRAAEISTGTGGTVAHFCVHPCPEHGAMVLVIWAAAISVALWGKVSQRTAEE
jgi:hypothetical protein